MLAAEAGETAQMREIATAITRLPVSQDDGPLTALEWVMDPGETEIEEVESIADIAARPMGQEKMLELKRKLNMGYRMQTIWRHSACQ